MHVTEPPFRAILNTNTQTRRLGYLVRIVRDVRDNHRGERELISRLEEWGETSKKQLNKYISNKGILRPSSTSSGANRYIDLSQRMDLITKVRNKYRPSKIGSVITYLDKPTKDNPFNLYQAQIPILYTVLINDFDYTVPLLSLTRKYSSQSNIRSNFYSEVLEHFERLYGIAKSSKKRDLKDRIQEMKRWNKPEKYLEHIVMPRLHWGLDLKLLDWNLYAHDGSFSLSPAGKRLLEAVPKYGQTPQVSVQWCQNELFKVWAQWSLEDYEVWDELTQTERMRLIRDRVKEASGIFQTMAYPRLPALQTVFFTIVTLLYRDHIAAGFDDIKQSLQREAEKERSRWDFRWFRSDDDGFIRIRD